VRSPLATALITSTETLTYKDLNRRSTRLAYYIQQQGISPGSRIAICLERTAELVVAILAVLKTGCAYVPLDPAYPESRLTYMLEDAEVAAVITQQSYKEISGGDIITLLIEEVDSEKSPTDIVDVALKITVSPKDLAYIIYTSGSTGQAKGVAIEHRSPVALVQWANEVYSPDQLSGVLAATSVCFDLSIFELFVPLSMGGCVILAEDVLQLPGHPAAPQMTLINTVPTAIAELIRLGSLPTSVTTINLAGEPIPTALVQQLYRQPSIQQVYNLYGPSEDTTYSTYTLLTLEDPVVSIGKPIANTQTYVLDDYQALVPVGVPGELFLGGSGLAQGYWNRPELTKEKFITLENISASPLYRTGDLVRRRPDGQLDFLGRIDSQVKVRGFRIELGEVEAALLKHPDIVQATASVHIDEQENSRLVAHLVLANVSELEGVDAGQTLPGSLALVESVRSHLQTLLPSYMLPARYISLAALPLLPNGKINRKALPAPVAVSLSANTRAAFTPTERTLIEIWQGLLNQPVDVYNNFFELGGDSILAIQAVAQAKQSGLQFSPRDLFQNPTIAQLATVAQGQSLPSVSQAAIVGSVPLTPMQQWFFQLPLTAPHHWNQSVLLSSSQPLQIDCLTQALKLLMQHHDGLRATFQHTDNRWQQRYLATSKSVPLSVVTGHASNCTQLIQTEAESAQASFDLSAGPLWKAIYFELEDTDKQEYRLFITCHHLLIDGVSWRILLSDLQQLYHQLTSPSAPNELPLFKTQSVKSWVEQLKAADFSDEVAYWTSVTSERGIPLTVDFPDGQNTMASAQTYSVVLPDRDTYRLLKELPEAYSARTEDILLTALLLAFTPEAGATMRLSLEGRGRSENLDLSRTVGWFTTLYPVLFNLPAKDDLGALIKATKETLRAVPNQGIGYGILRYLQGGELTRNLVDIAVEPPVRFNYLGQTDQLFSAEGLFSPAIESTGAARSPQDALDVLLEVNAVVSKGVLTTHWTYSSHCHQAETIAQWAQAYLSHLSALIDYCLSADADRGYSPTDFPQMGLDQGELDALLSSIGGKG
ncbi:MAG: amino acid adenylation domain-containing protein, partial [Cyanobacteria bacterium J06649_4]